MTINNTANKVIAAGNGVMTVFDFSFVGVEASDIDVIYTDTDGNETALAAAQYTLVLNAAPPGQIWGLGGTVTYPLTGSPIALGTTLTIVRNLPLTQEVALGNQGNEFPSAVETAIDLVEMQLQQVSETFQRAIVAPIVDPSTVDLTLPPAAQRANLVLGFDGSGDVVAIAAPASGTISSAMQPVVNAASLAAGRAAFGLGAMAVENIGAGLADDGAGNVRVLPPLLEVATSQAPNAASHTSVYMATGNLTFTLERGNTLFEGYYFDVYALTAAITFAVDSNDFFYGQSSGASYTIPKGCFARISTDAQTSATWYAQVSGISPKLNIQVFTVAGTHTYTPSPGLIGVLVEIMGGSGAGGGCTGTAGTAIGGGGGGGGQYSRSCLTAVQIGGSQTVTVGAAGASGGAGAGGSGGTSSLGSLISGGGGVGGTAGLAATSSPGVGGAGGSGGTGQVLIAGNAGSAGCFASIATTFYPSGKGGDSVLGAGGIPTLALGSAGAAGAAGGSYGGGGAGAQANNLSASEAGGNGAAGIVIVTEFLAAVA